MAEQAEQELLKKQLEIRESLVRRLREDLIGPAGGEQEVLVEEPLSVYQSAILYPELEGPSSLQDSENDGDEGGEGDDQPDAAVAPHRVRFPSSCGVTFALVDEVQEIAVSTRFATYSPQMPEGQMRRVWLRNPQAPEPIKFAVTEPGVFRKPVSGSVELHVTIRGVSSGARAVTVSLRNNHKARPGEMDAKALFQVGFSVRVSDGPEDGFVRRPARIGVNDEDLKTNRLIYRNLIEFAVGHGCSADWDLAGDCRTRAVSVSTTFMPVQKVPIMNPDPRPEVMEGLDASSISENQPSEIVGRLRRFVAKYEDWIDGELTIESIGLEPELQETARRHIDQCRDAVSRMRAGISCLERDSKAMEAFKLANEAMAIQRSGWGASDDKFRWRPFQLGFILLSLESIVDPEADSRDIVDLLWFPTGGGKTEAYLGLFAFTIFLRRLRDPEDDGVTTIMRYTLRLLTLQQFERAARLVCACEWIRDRRQDLGPSRISLGLYVGSASTPNRIKGEDSALRILNRKKAGKNVSSDPCQLQRCPCCGVGFTLANYEVREDPDRFTFVCRNTDCPFLEVELPVWVVDEDVYRERPSLLIATIDKFAVMSRNPDFPKLLGVDHQCSAPELIIQDELHLIAGPLGSIAGLYEVAVDAICESVSRRPKVVASTATIRRANDQGKSLFGRRDVRQFPPPGLDAADSWFAVQAKEEARPGRMYVGAMTSGKSHAMLLIRSYASLIDQASKFGRGPEVDPYWTVLGYFNSLRVLGAANMQVRDDVRERLSAANEEGTHERDPLNIEELTSRKSAGEIAKIIPKLENPADSGEAFDVVLATNMISVGVDVPRLGLMVVMGQPQATAEYIQATSRVGRQHPGLVIVLLNAAKARDRSHFEGFRWYHEAVYEGVEAGSVTPFAARARDRALHAVLVATVRALVPALREQDAAGRIGEFTEEVSSVIDRLVERIGRAYDGDLDSVREQFEHFVGRWKALADQAGDVGGLVFWEAKYGSERMALLRDASGADDFSSEPFPTMQSMRNVDSESRLVQGAFR